RTDSVSEERRGHCADVVSVLHIVQQVLKLRPKCHRRASLLVNPAIGSTVSARATALSGAPPITAGATLSARPAREAATWKSAAGQTASLRLSKIIDTGWAIVAGPDPFR